MPTREASIHITERRLSIILTQLLPFGTDVLGFTREVVKRARPYSLNSRAIITSTDRLKQKAEKITSSPSIDADTMARVIYMVRKKMKHIGITQIKPSSRDWDQVKLITAQANEFCIDMDLPKRAGYIEYITLAFNKMAKPILNKVVSMHSAICETYLAKKEISEDPTPDLTLQVHEYYRRKVATKTGLINNFKNEPNKYVWFVRASKLMSELTVPLNIYIDSQFEAFDYRNAMPDPSQLVGQKSKERLNKYLFEHNLDLRRHGNNKHN